MSIYAGRHNMITINIICNIMTEKKNKKREKNMYKIIIKKILN